AHPMLPHLGQGANQSIEDGMALATILALCDVSTASAALNVYERLRRERVAAVQRGARENGMRYDSVYAELARGAGAARAARSPLSLPFGVRRSRGSRRRERHNPDRRGCRPRAPRAARP